MELKEQLLNALRNELSEESAYVFEQNIRKQAILLEDIPIRQPWWGLKVYKKGTVMYYRSWCNSLATIFITLVLITTIGLVEKFIGNILNLNLFISILIIFAVLVVAAITIYFVVKLIKYTYSVFDNKINSMQPKSVEAKNYDYDDNVYYIISSTYETLCEFRKERERQAKNSFNVALSLVIVGVLIVFGGVFLLFKKNIVEGVLSSTVGSISSIIGGTIIKLYKDTNDRMDKLDANLSTLNYAKVQYALILKINDEKKRDVELSALVKSIGKISK